MKTQELKSYIDRVLGNSIRCLLPSYWWKRAFGAVIDNTISKDEVKTINGESILGEGDLRVGVKSVESVEALEKLDAVVGDIATVGASVPIQVKIADCYYSVDFEKDWDKYTAITRVEEIGLISDTEERAVNLYKFKDGRYVSTIIIGTENGYRVYKISKNDTYEDISLEEINGILAKNEYRFGIGYRWADIDSFFRFYTNSVSADAYIKGETWTRFLKDGDVTGGGESCSCTEEVIFYAADNTRGYSLTADEKAKNVEAFNKQWEAYQNKTPLNRVVCVRGDVTLYMPAVYFLPSNTSTLNVLKGATLEEYYVYVNSDGSATYSERKGLDEVLSTTSQNPVQNKVVTEALGILEEHLAVHAQQIASLGLSMATKKELNNKADKSDIKTINGVSLLGGGDITISGGGVSEDYVNTAIANAITNTLNTEV